MIRRKPLVFLSHSGMDTHRAEQLTQRMRAAGLEVWFDKHDLVPGTAGWQAQLATAISNDVSAFAVLVTSNGVVNWVEAEVSLAVSRAIKAGGNFPVVPILAADAEGSAALPPFARQFQSVRDIENDPFEWEKFLTAIKGDTTLITEPEPFFSLRAIDHKRSHLFFGRETETKDITRIIAEQGILLVTGDSGSGKSSLLRAGLSRAWMGNDVGLKQGARPGEYDWYVVTSRPGTDPFRFLGEAVETAGIEHGLSPQDLKTYTDYCATEKFNDIRRGLRVGLDPERTRTLLIIDQFEEILNPKIPLEVKRRYCEMILALSDRDDPSVTVAMSMRSDYSNRLRNDPLQPLFERLEQNNRAARYMLGALSGKGLQDIVEKPLFLAGHGTQESIALGELIRKEVGTRPGDLALIQFALTKTWDTRSKPGYDKNLLQAYAGVGRVEGALAKEADRVYGHLIAKGFDEATVEAAMIRLGSLSGRGPVRRVAQKSEFSDRGWEVIQHLASKDGNRLVLISGHDDVAEIAHEALLTQWDELGNWLTRADDDKRSLDQLADRMADPVQLQPPMQNNLRGDVFDRYFDRYSPAVELPPKVIYGAELQRFSTLAEKRPSWLTQAEHDVISGSQEYQKAVKAREDRQRNLFKTGLKGLLGFGALATAALLAVGWFWWSSAAANRLAQTNLSAALISLAELRVAAGQHETAAKLAIAALDEKVTAHVSARALNVLQNYHVEATGKMTLAEHEGLMFSVSFSPDGGRIVSGGTDDTVRIWDAQSGAELQRLTGHEGAVYSVGFSPDGGRIVSGGSDETVRIWDAQSGAELQRLTGHEGSVNSIDFSPDGGRIVSGSSDDTVRIWDAQSGAELQRLKGHEGSVYSVGFSPDGGRIVSGGSDETVRIWDAQSGAELQRLTGHERSVLSVGFSHPDGERIVSGGDDGTVRIWDAQSGAELQRLTGHEDFVRSVGFSPDGGRIVSGGDDGTVRIWDFSKAYAPNILQLACVDFASRDVSELEADTGLKIGDICTERHLSILLQ